MLPILLFSIIGFAYSIPEASSCPNGTMQSALNSSICYYYVNISYTAEPQGGAAETFCMGYNGHLASATNAFVNNEITSNSIFTKTKKTHLGYLKSVVSNPDDLIWIGGYTDFDVEHGKLVYKWKWTDTRRVFTYTNFQNGNDTGSFL